MKCIDFTTSVYREPIERYLNTIDTNFDFIFNESSVRESMDQVMHHIIQSKISLFIRLISYNNGVGYIVNLKTIEDFGEFLKNSAMELYYIDKLKENKTKFYPVIDDILSTIEKLLNYCRLSSR